MKLFLSLLFTILISLPAGAQQALPGDGVVTGNSPGSASTKDTGPGKSFSGQVMANGSTGTARHQPVTDAVKNAKEGKGSDSGITPLTWVIIIILVLVGLLNVDWRRRGSENA